MSAQPSTPTAARLVPMVNPSSSTASRFAPKGSMIIHAADKARHPIPRFCYHEKLPIAANCRMCLVEAEMGGAAQAAAGLRHAGHGRA
jgi:NADH-quinone oxidoreductase subunit G